MTIRHLLPVVAMTTVLAGGGPALAQSSAAQTTSGALTLFMPLAVAKLSDLSFGTVMRPTSGGGNVSVNATTGQVTAGGGAAVMSGGPGGAASRAAFEVTGEGGLNFSVVVPQNFIMTRTGGQETLQVSLVSTTGGGTLSGRNGSAGSAAFGIGGSTQLNSTTQGGTYTGTFTITVAYN